MTNPTEVLARVIRDTLEVNRFDASTAAYRQIVALNAAGFQIVPKEPDDSMTLAAQTRAAIAAAPKP